jgi:hypothetical protein
MSRAGASRFWTATRNERHLKEAMPGDSAVPKKRPTDAEFRRALSPPSKFGENAATTSSDAIGRKQKSIFTMSSDRERRDTKRTSFPPLGNFFGES